MNPEQLEKLNRLEEEVNRLSNLLKSFYAASTIPLEIGEAFKNRVKTSTNVKISTNNVSNPPTASEINTAFGMSPAQVGEGFIGIIDDNNSGTNVWLIVSIANGWWYEQLTQA